MSPEEKKVSEKIRELPHMNDERIEVLEKHGIRTPEELLLVIRDKEKWDSIHSELKGIGPKTIEQWEKLLETGYEKKEEEKKKGREEKTKKPAEEGNEGGAEPSEQQVEIVEEGAYVPKKKAKISAELKDALKKRVLINDSRPEFRRQEYGRYKKLESGWRKPRGIHSKMRMRMRYRRSMVSVGYRGPRKARGLHPSGFEEVMVRNQEELSKVKDVERQAVRIAHAVGQRKRTMIIERADELGIRVLNRGE